jgi:hypothetical protein
MNRVKIRGARGPFCLSHTDMVLVPELRPPARWLATIAPSQSSDVRNCNRLSLAPKFRPTSPESVSECIVKVTLTVCDTSLRKSERARKASNKETAPRSHRVTHQAGRQKVTKEPSQRGSQSLSHLHIPDGHPLANISPGKG